MIEIKDDFEPLPLPERHSITVQVSNPCNSNHLHVRFDPPIQLKKGETYLILF